MPSSYQQEQSTLARPNHRVQIDQVLAAIQRLRTADSAATCLEHLVEATRAIGSRASLYLITIPEASGEISGIALFACDPAFAQCAFERVSLEQHPWVRFARSHAEPATHVEIESFALADAAALALARQHGFESYLLVPTMTGAGLGRTGLLCLGQDEDATFEGPDRHLIRLLARALACELHDWFTAQLREGFMDHWQLQSEDVHLLALEWDGLGTKEIAQRLGLSQAAIDSRFQRINRRLNCNSRSAAARRAAEHGVLDHCARLPTAKASSKANHRPLMPE